VKQFKTILSGGGTGGHIFPALAIANAIKSDNGSAEILFVGASQRMEMKRVPKAGFPIKGLWISGIQRKLSLQNLLFPLKLIVSLWRSYFILKRFQPKVVIGTGGFASGPLLYMATRMNIPSLIQEQNALPGITNRFLGKYVQRICIAHGEAARFFPKHKTELTGNPLRSELIQLNISPAEARKKIGLSQKKTTLLVVGGSLGARRINQLMANHHGRLSEMGVQIVWQCGSLYEKEYVALQTSHVHIMPFIDDMAVAYAAADVIISRAGALAVSELCQVGKAVLFIPSPNVAENHQYKNALAIAKKDAAFVIEENELDQKFQTQLDVLISDKKKRDILGKNIKNLAKPDATQSIVKQIKSLVND
jgi:UDP-N-acetylglucosamine--N-acetylmuramyl-(pentapeptide) pyrophosphoryl-undecaprenol N-acetylglucosamine transferase